MQALEPSSDRWKQDLLRQALTRKTLLDRAAFLDEACRGDAVTRVEMEAWLAIYEGGERSPVLNAEGGKVPLGEGLTEEIPTLLDETLVTEGPGTVIGRYKLLEQVGEGGFGVVYLAEQRDPVRRQVALKIIKLGMDTRQVVARFEAERQALALMDHPNIAKVFDAGATDNGRPFFVMELVKGIPIPQYCDQEKLGTVERLKLFIAVCQAIQHAHQKGIIHRDIKPSNILVTLQEGTAVPKVIDFGIAKATQQKLTEKTLHTRLEQFIGTPAYMSPEQAEMSGLDIDTRSDIYSLGVLLYELLTGKTPFDSKELLAAGLDEIRRTIREKEPMRPSTRLSTMGKEELTTTTQRRGAEAPKLISLLRGDLDWIVMKCLEKDRTRRYETANGLAMDLQRHLNNEAVIARPPSTAYRFQKLARRNRVLFAAVGAVATALVAGVVVSTMMFLREQQARQDAARQKDEARRNEQAAIAERERARRLSYASDMNVAWRALAENNLGEVMSLLEAQIPAPGDPDLRDWEWRYFWNACRGDQVWTLGPMQGEVMGLALLPEGRLATGIAGRPGEVRIWDLERRQVVRRAGLDPNNLSDLAVSPDGRQLAVATWETKVRLLDATTLEPVGELQHEKPIWKVLFSTDGKLLSAHGSEDVSIWDITTRKRLWSTNTPSSSSTMAPFSGDGKWVACQMGDGSVAFLGAVDGVPIRQIIESVQFFSSPLVISRDGRWLAAGNWDNQVLLIDPAATRFRLLTNHHAAVRAVAFSPDSRQLATAGGDRLVKLWDVESGRETASLRGHRKGIMSLIYSTDGQRIFTSAEDGTVCAWPTHPSRPGPISNLPTMFFTYVLSRDGRFIAGSETNDVLRVVALETLRETGRVAITERFECLAIGPEGHEISIGLTDGTVRVWDLAEREARWSFQAHSNQVDVLAFSPDGSLLATAARGGEVSVWDLKNKRPVLRRVLGVVGYRVSDLVFALDGGTLVVPAYGQIHLINLQPGGQDRSTANEESFSIDISRDGSLVAAGMNEEVRVFEVSSLRQVALLHGSLGAFNSVSFSPDHHRVVASDNVGTTWLWDLATRREVGRFGPKHGPGVVHARFQPNGDTVVIHKEGSHFDGLELLRTPSWEVIEAAGKRTEGHTQ